MARGAKKKARSPFELTRLSGPSRYRPIPPPALSPALKQAAATISLKDLYDETSLTAPEGVEEGWSLAERYHLLMQKFGGRHSHRLALEREVCRAIILRARQIMRSAETIKRRRIEPFSEPGRGELLIEESMEELLTRPDPRPADLRVSVREERNVDIALMLDTSYSMTGRKLALSAVTAAVLACKSPRQRYSITLFQSMAHVIKHLGESLSLEQLVLRIFRQSNFGYTNLEDALKVTRRELGRTRRPGRRVGVLITDGKITSGGDPMPQAARFDALHVIMAEDRNMDRQMCLDLAAAGHGKVFGLQSFETLPRLFYQILRTVTR